ncbi:hypothetical protein LPW11_16250 [Geomonas sp. RF6]|uniref:hypothetical protein n=1 Tax=Geomonas sp. RF6 TaxID=2897342 RepID=UPI001E5263F1|nr:hypothetical protein [Geomonas sp. RF6]UFS69440.1 hypothetical protein LPW11_16250 [Geomonas sp. RF6]
MTSTNSHSFSPVGRDGSGTIATIRSTSCAQCHKGPAYLDAVRMATRETKFAASLLALQKVLEGRGIYYSEASPYFFKSAGSTDAVNAFTAWGSADTMGAAFNFSLLKHEPGAYAHNMLYSKRLIYDSIDYLDDGALNDTVVAAINALPDLDMSLKGAAAAYLGPMGRRP